jgi:hypothetical protein
MYDFGKSIIADRHYRIFVVLSYKVFVGWALVSHTEVSHVLKVFTWELFHGERLVWREEKPC